MQLNNYIQELLGKFILNRCSREEIEEIIIYIQGIKESSEIPSVEDVLELLDEKPVMSDGDALRIQNNILEIAKKPNYKLNRNRNYIWQYAAAALLVGVLGVSYFFSSNFFNGKIENTTPVIVSPNNIVPGTDKATLTLEDGSQVALEKGSSIQTQNANSNGKKIIYKKKKENHKEVKYNYLTIPRGSEYFLQLADGTQVWLNSESQLKYPVSFIKGKARQVELIYGEAYFDVSPSTEHNGSKFIVLNQSQRIEVLGTEFNIKAYKEESNIYTTLVEGKVVVGNGILKQNLEPNLQSNLDIKTNSITVAKVDVKAETSWKDGVFNFVNKPLKDIAKVMSRWYDVDIVFENKELELVEFVGALDKHQSIEEILSIMKSSSISNYEINGKTIILN